MREMRKAEGLSQEKLALMTGVERSYLAKLETGARNPSIDIIEKIAHGLNVTLSQLFEGTDSGIVPPSNGANPSADASRPHGISL